MKNLFVLFMLLCFCVTSNAQYQDSLRHSQTILDKPVQTLNYKPLYLHLHRAGTSGFVAASLMLIGGGLAGVGVAYRKDEIALAGGVIAGVSIVPLIACFINLINAGTPVYMMNPEDHKYTAPYLDPKH